MLGLWRMLVKLWFFEKELLNLEFSDLSKWHKYPIEVTKKRLDEMNLFQRREEIQKLLGGN